MKYNLKAGNTAEQRAEEKARENPNPKTTSKTLLLESGNLVLSHAATYFNKLPLTPVEELTNSQLKILTSWILF